MMVLVKLQYEIGDACWIMKGNQRCAGRVVQKLTIPDHFSEFYLIEPVDDYLFTLEVRDALLMSEARDGIFPFTQTGRAR